MHFRCEILITPIFRYNWLPNIINEIMLPLCGNHEDCFEFIDCTDEILNEYQNESRQGLVLQNGTFVNFKHRLREDSKLPAGSRFEDVPFTKAFATVDDFRKDWHGSDVQNEEGKWGYYANPNGICDYYLIGGCWENPKDKGATAVNSDRLLERGPILASTIIDALDDIKNPTVLHSESPGFDSVNYIKNRTVLYSDRPNLDLVEYIKEHNIEDALCVTVDCHD